MTTVPARERVELTASPGLGGLYMRGVGASARLAARSRLGRAAHPVLPDVEYVLNGLCVAYGIDLPAVFKAVHESNMEKSGGPRREDGKVLKPPGWQPPNIQSILESQGPLV